MSFESRSSTTSAIGAGVDAVGPKSHRRRLVQLLSAMVIIDCLSDHLVALQFPGRPLPVRAAESWTVLTLHVLLMLCGVELAPLRCVLQVALKTRQLRQWKLVHDVALVALCSLFMLFPSSSAPYLPTLIYYLNFSEILQRTLVAKRALILNFGAKW